MQVQLHGDWQASNTSHARDHIAKKIIFINPSNFKKQYLRHLCFSSVYRVSMNGAKSFVIQRIAKLQQTFKQSQAQTAIFHSKA